MKTEQKMKKLREILTEIAEWREEYIWYQEMAEKALDLLDEQEKTTDNFVDASIMIYPSKDEEWPIEKQIICELTELFNEDEVEDGNDNALIYLDKAIRAVEEVFVRSSKAIKNKPAQEPVGEIGVLRSDGVVLFSTTLPIGTQLYDRPQPAPPLRLTKDEIECARLEWCQTGWDVTEYTNAIMDMMQAKTQPAPDVRELIEAAILDAQLRCFENSKIDTPDEIQRAAFAALAKHTKPTQLVDSE